MQPPVRMSFLAAAVAVALAAALAWFAPASAQGAGPAFPALSGRIVDAAGLIPLEARGRIEGKLAAHEAKTTDQLVVATVPSLQDVTIEDYANRLFRAWKLGEAKTNNGVLFLVAPKERKLRIEVGYGLEGALTDALSKVIITTAVTPRFKSGDFAGGIEAGVDGILAVLSSDADEWMRRAQVREESAGAETIVVVVIIAIVIVFFLLAVLNAARRGGSKRWHRTRNGRWVMLPTTSSSSTWGSGWSSSSSSGWSSGGDSGGFSGGGGSSGGGGASGDW